MVGGKVIHTQLFEREICILEMANKGIAEDIFLQKSDKTFHSCGLLNFICFKEGVFSPSAEKAHPSLDTGIT